MIVDAHLHIYPAFVGTPDGRGPVSLNYGRILQNGKVVQALPPSFERSSSPPEVALAYMDVAGVEKALLTQGPYYGFFNDYVAQAVYRWPERFYGLACYNPTLGQRGPDDLERWMTEWGLQGIKCEVPSTRGRWPDFSLLGKREMAVWERCAELNGVLMLHLDTGRAAAGEVQRLVEALPSLKVIVCHLGMPPAEGWQEQTRLARHENVYLDMAGVPFLYRDREDYPYPQAQGVLEWAVREVGAHKIMWGTDYPSVLRTNTYVQLIDFVRRYCRTLTEEERDMVLGGTAESLLSRAGVR